MPLPFITGAAQQLTRQRQAQTEEEARRKRLAYESMLRGQERAIPQALPPSQVALQEAQAGAAGTLQRQREAGIVTQQQEQLQAQQLGLMPPQEELVKKYRPVINIAKGLPKERQDKIKRLFQAQLGGTEQEVALQRVRDMIAKKISDLETRGLQASYVNGRLRIQPKKETTGIDLGDEMRNLFELSDNPKEAQIELQFLIDTGMLDNAQAADLWDTKFK